MEYDNEAAQQDQEKAFGVPKEQALKIQEAIQKLYAEVHKALDDTADYQSILEPRDKLKAACENYLRDINATN